VAGARVLWGWSGSEVRQYPFARVWPGPVGRGSAEPGQDHKDGGSAGASPTARRIASDRRRGWRRPRGVACYARKRILIVEDDDLHYELYRSLATMI